MNSPQGQEYIIDSETLISSVHQTPLIWNSGHRYYRDRLKRRKAWIQICHSLFEDFESKDEIEKDFISKQIETKWRHIRDNFRREMRNAGSKNKRPYVYAEQLDFLRPIMEKTMAAHRKDEEPIKSDEYNDHAETFDDAEDDSDDPVVPKKRKISRAPAFEETMVPFERVDTHSKQEYAEDDDDTSFFKSLTPMLATLSPQQKIKFRIEVMQQLLKCQNYPTSPPSGQFD